MPDPQEANRLDIDIGTGVPILIQTRPAYTEEGRPVRVSISIMPGDPVSG